MADSPLYFGGDRCLPDEQLLQGLWDDGEVTVGAQECGEGGHGSFLEGWIWGFLQFLLARMTGPHYSGLFYFQGDSFLSRGTRRNI